MEEDQERVEGEQVEENGKQEGGEEKQDGENVEEGEKEADAPPAKTPEQLEQQRRLQEEQTKRLQQQARAKAEQQRLKLEQDTKKLEQALKGSLSKIGTSTDNRSMQYTTLILAEKQLQRLFSPILVYKHIKYLDLNTNSLTDISLLAEFKDLVTLNVSKNQIASLLIFNQQGSFLKLQVLNLLGNKVQELSNIHTPVLVRLNLDENEIAGITWKGHPSIQYLELRKNKLKKCQEIAGLKSLKELHLEENEISDIRGLADLPSLSKLYLTTNKIKKILSPFPFLPSLTHIDISGNLLTKVEEINKIDKHVYSINIKENPLSDELGDNLKKDFACIYPHFESVNEQVITPEERKEFEREWKEKLAEQERERLEREKEAEEVRKAEEEEQKRVEEEQRQQEEERRLQEEQANPKPQEQPKEQPKQNDPEPEPTQEQEQK